MSHTLVARLGSLVWLATSKASNAWTRLATRTAFDPAAARRVAGLRYWDGDFVA